MEIRLVIDMPQTVIDVLNRLADALSCEIKLIPQETLKQAVSQPSVPVQQAPQVPQQIMPQQVPIAPQIQQASPAPQTPVPTTDVSYTYDQLAVAAAQLMDAGRRDELITIITQFGVKSLTELPKDKYGLFANALRSAGVNI